MDIYEAIVTRRNIKKFKSDLVNQDKVRSWLQSASMAPNHRMKEPWEILWVGPETRAKLNHKRNFGDAPIVLAILSKHGATTIESEENMVAVSCFVQNFLLLAWSEGVGTSWSSLGTSQVIRRILNVTAEFEIIGIFGVGYPEEIPLPKDRKLIEGKMKFLS